MWGYIAAFYEKHISAHVPSLYVRVYRFLAVCIHPYFRSLIICEGISGGGGKNKLHPKFPHYMWGYIVAPGMDIFNVTVPSLYVRVYRWGTAGWPEMASSLIICEGISCKNPLYDIYESFPHYMWGYIASPNLISDNQDVPSLYVRVYRYLRPIRCQTPSSLTTCECISKSATASFRHQKI